MTAPFRVRKDTQSFPRGALGFGKALDWRPGAQGSRPRSAIISSDLGCKSQPLLASVPCLKIEAVSASWFSHQSEVRRE